MTVDADTPDLPQGADLADSSQDAPSKPARRKRAPKAVEANPDMPQALSDVASLVPADGAPQALAEDMPAKPARKRRSPAPSSASSEGVSGENEPAVATSPVLQTPALEGLPADQRAEPAAAPAGDAVMAPVSGDAQSEASGSVAGEVTEGEGGGRNRRRRKDRSARPDRDGAPESVEAGGPGAEPAPQSQADSDADDEEEEAASGQARPAQADPKEVFAQVVSGEFDAGDDELPEPPPPHKRVLLPEPEAPKLQKVLAQSGIGSRRDMEALIQEGQVSVNGEVAHTGQRISFGDRIQVRGKPIRVRIVPPAPRIIAYHKPVGEVVTHDDPQQRPTVFRRLPRLPQGKWQSVGRLDLNTEGLLLFTNSGELANQLMHPRFGVEREYAVRVLGKLDENDKAQLLDGVSIDGQTASFRSIEDGGGEGANHWYRVVITEGRNREVRKLFDAVELTVSRLIRIRYGTVVLPRGLKRGVWVDLDPVDVRAIRSLAGGGPKAEARGPQQNPGQGGAGQNARSPQDRGRNKGRPERQGGDRPFQDRPGQDRPQHGKGPQGGQQGNGPRQQQPRPSQQDYQAPPERKRDDDLDDDFDPSRIPNPLEQTFDKRFVQNPRTPAGGRGFGRGGGGFGAGGSAPPASAPRKPGAPREPDPLQTSVGYIGADAFHRKQRGGGGGGGGGNRSGGGGGGFGGGNRGGGGGKRGR